MAGTSETPSGIPGFDFLQGLFQNASAGLPAMGAWIAPTLKPEELDKRIQELKTVQFWLEQNARLLASTIQALEVQRMTLATLQTLNLPLADLGEALRIKVPAQTAPEPTAAPAALAALAVPAPVAPTQAPAEAAPVVDPMQWWSALTRQFGELAAKAVRDAPATSAAATTAAAAGSKVADPAKAKSASKPAARAAAKAPAKAPRRAP